MSSLTGKTRFKALTLASLFAADRTFVLLQVEEQGIYDYGGMSPSGPIWRDATVEDLAELTRMKALAPWQVEP